MAEPSPSTIPFVERMPRPPLVWNNHSMAWISDRIAGIVENKAPRWWWVAIATSGSLAAFGTFCILYLLFTGVGVWGNNIPVGWAWGITNFVFWIGIGHAGTLISAILHLCRQKWRTSINRAAEAMTLFAVMCAGIFPAIHVGRIWMIWFVAPVPNPNWIWPNFRSPLMWDVFAVSTYFTVSVLFWYLGLVPDLATMRDRAKGKVRRARSVINNSHSLKFAKIRICVQLGLTTSRKCYGFYKMRLGLPRSPLRPPVAWCSIGSARNERAAGCTISRRWHAHS